jgi:hypothetical protein
MAKNKLVISKDALQALLEEFSIEEIAAQKKVHTSTVYRVMRENDLVPIFHSPLTPRERQNYKNWKKTIGDPQGLSYETLPNSEQYNIRQGARTYQKDIKRIVALESSAKAKALADATKVKTIGHVKELETWIETNAHKYKDVDKFYKAALREFDKPKYKGLVRESIQPAKKNVRNPVKAGKHLYLPSYRAEAYARTGDIGGEIPKGGRYNYKNLFELKGVDAGSRIRYVKDMMLINMLDKNLYMKTFAKKLDKVVLNDFKDLSSTEIDEVKLFTRKHLKATAARPNLFRSYLNKRHKGFEELRNKRIQQHRGIYAELKKRLDDPARSDAAKKKIRNTMANMDRSRKYHIKFKQEFPDLFKDKKVYSLKFKAERDVFEFEHKISKGTAAINKLPETYYIRGSYVPSSFNQAKLKNFDTPLFNLMNEYRETKNPKIETQIKDLFNDFNKKSAGYLDKVKPYFDRSSGSVIVEDATPIYKIKDYADYKTQLGKNLKHSQAYLSTFKEGRYAFDTSVLAAIFNKEKYSVQNNIANALNCGKSEGGRIGYALGSATIKCVNTKLANDPVRSSMALRTTEGIGKMRGAATNFLKMLGRGGVKAAPYAAIGALGVAAEPLVKKFYIDDPTTYLTDENQQKGFLLSMIEAETPKVDQEILNWQYPGMAAATAAGAIPGAGAVYKARRGIAPSRDFIGPMHKGVGKTRAALGLSGVLGKALGASFSPLAAAATTPFHIASQRKAGTDWADIAASPGNWMGPAFMGGGYKMAAAGIKNPTLLKALRLGMSPRALMLGSRFGLAGLLGTAGLAGYDMYKNLRKKEPLKAVRYPDEQ